MNSKLVFDIGANDGRDTEYYLAKGFNVLAVDADPRLCDQIRAEKTDAIAAGRLTVVNVGVGRENGTMPFYVSSFSEWSSFRTASKATSTNEYTVIDVPICPLANLIEAHGVPYYLKIDIEGLEWDALSSIDPRKGLPELISFEVNKDWDAIVELLVGHGYTSFQLVRQGAEHLPAPPIPAQEGLSVPYNFTNGHSGCFGRDLPDLWQPATALRNEVTAALAAAQDRRAAGQRPGWFDIHVRRT